MFKLIRSAIAFISAYWRGYTPFGQFFLTLGAFAGLVDAVICYNYGITQTFWHGVGFALLAVVIGVLPDAAAQEWERGGKGSAITIAIGCILMLPVAYQSHLGYSAGVRVGDIRVTQAKMDVAANDVDTIEQARKDKAMAESALARLKWLPSDVTAAGTRSAIETKEEAIRQETKRGGCGPNCLKLRTELSELEKQRGAIEDVSKERARLDAANAWLNNAKTKVASAETVNSTTVNQNRVASQLFNLMRGQSAADAINPDRVTETFVNTGISGANSLAFMLMFPLCWFVAGRNRLRVDIEPTAPNAAREATTQESTNQQAPAQPSMSLQVQSLADVRRKLAFASNRQAAA